MVAFIIVILILLAFGVLGAVVKGLLWLTAIAVLAAIAAAAYAWWKFRGARTT